MQTDFNGNYTFFNTIYPECTDKPSLEIGNSYAEGNILHISINGTSGRQYVISLFDALGNLVATSNGQSGTTEKEIVLNTGYLSKGIYLISLLSDNHYNSRKIMLGPD